MQASTVFFNDLSPFKCTTTKGLLPTRLPRPQRAVRLPVAFAAPASDASTVDYSSTASVFPAEACETIGGEACGAGVFPEVKPEAQVTGARATVGPEEVDREYMEYNDTKTVFPGEACDDLGGEFCEPEYQQGVFVEKTASK